MTAETVQRASRTRRDVTAVGEALLRYSVLPHEHLASASSFRVHVGGAESNVCAALAQLGRRSAWVSALPDHALGKLILRRLQEAEVDTSAVRLIEGGRVGTYYLESSPPPKATTVIYDRADSAFTRLTAADLDLGEILDTAIIHSTGITPALGPNPRALLTTLFREARHQGVKVSFDVNYREKLWTPEEASSTLAPFLQAADILFCSLRDACRLFGAAPDGADAARTLRQHSAAELIVISMGPHGIYAEYDLEKYSVPAAPTVVVDRPGAGDAMAAGVLDGYLAGDVPGGLTRGAVLASIALSHYGDMISTSRKELDAATETAPGEIIR